MRVTRLGSLEVSVVGLGCNNFGRALDERGSATVVDAALWAGINVFDVSDNYGQGRAESYLAAALGDRREEVVIATKFATPVPGIPDSGGAHPEYIRRAIDRSLTQLRTDYIDLYQLHKPDPSVPIEAVLEELAGLIRQGKVREIGCSNLDADQLTAAMEAARENGHPHFLSDQVEYSLLHRTPEHNGLIDACQRHQVSLLPYYPLASGMLTGKARRGQPLEGRLQMDRYQRYLVDSNFDLVDSLRTFADQRKLSMAQVAIGWLLAQPTVPFVTAGATRPEQVAINASGAEWEPSPEDLRELDQLTLHPGASRG